MTKSTHKDDALALLDELRAGYRISSVEAQVLWEGIDVSAVSLTSPPIAVRTLNDLFDALGGPAAVGRAIGKGTEHAHSMKTRGSVPIAYWPKLIRACQDAGMQIDANGLLAIHLAPRIDKDTFLASSNQKDCWHTESIGQETLYLSRPIVEDTE